MHKSLRQLLSRPNAVEKFNRRVERMRQVARVIDESPQQFILSFSTWKHRIADQEDYKFQPGDSAVFIPLVEVAEEPHVIFTHRSYLLRNHRGEISFPGGKMDEDESPEQVGS
jgi:hypothetical protein